MLGGNWNRSRCPIGIDLGTHSVKLLQLSRGPSALGSYTAIAAASRTLPTDSPPDGAERCGLLTELIRDMLTSQPFVGCKVVSCLPVTAIQYKNLRLPKMPADDLHAAVEWEATDRLNLPSDEVYLQYFNAGEVRQGEELRQEIIVMAAHRAAVQEHLAMLTGCDLQPVAIDVVPGALARCLGRFDPADLQAPARVVLDMGFSSSKVVIVRNGRVVFFKLIDIGGRKLDETVARHLNLSVAEAAELRRRLRDDEPEGEGDSVPFGSTGRENVKRAVFEAMRSVVQDLSKELQLCLRYYSVTFRGRRPEQVTLVGGESRDPSVVEVLADGTRVAIEPAQSLNHVDLSPLKPSPDGGEASAGDAEPPSRSTANDDPRLWAVAAGLSMRPDARALRKRGAA